jgi:hypothetical protein
LLIRQDAMFDAYVQAIRDCGNYDKANVLAEVLPSLRRLDEDQIGQLVDAYNSNGEVYGSFGFNGMKSYTYGAGLISHLHRLGAKQYEMLSGPSHEIRLSAHSSKKGRK